MGRVDAGVALRSANDASVTDGQPGRRSEWLIAAERHHHQPRAERDIDKAGCGARFEQGLAYVDVNQPYLLKGELQLNRRYGMAAAREPRHSSALLRTAPLQSRCRRVAGVLMA